MATDSNWTKLFVGTAAAAGVAAAYVLTRDPDVTAEIAEYRAADAAGRLRVGEWFPNAPRACREQATRFFECLDQAGAAAGGDGAEGNSAAALRGCLKEMALYDRCMKGRPLQDYRVQEEYRVREK
jgi:hypothetical protein